MNDFWKLLVWLYVPSALLTALLLSELAIFVLVLTAGLTLPLFLFAPNFLVYATTPLTGIYYSRYGLKPSRTVIAIIAVTILIACLPSYVSMKAAEGDFMELARTDTALGVRQRPRDVEIVWSFLPSSRYKPNSPTTKESDAPCKELCQGLLTSEQVSSVTVTVLNGKMEPWYTVAYSLESKSQCPGFSVEQKNTLQRTLVFAKQGKCIVSKIDKTAPANAIQIRILSGNSYRSYIENMKFEWGQSARTLEIIDPNASPRKRLRFKQSELTANIIALPLLVLVDGGSDLKFRPALKRKTHVFNKIDIVGILRKQLGYTISSNEIAGAASTRQ